MMARKRKAFDKAQAKAKKGKRKAKAFDRALLESERPRSRRQAKGAIDEGQLTKGQIRKLNALRKSLGPEIADRAFAEWLEKFAAAPAAPEDKNAEVIATALLPLIEEKKLRIPRGGYLVTRGRGRVIVVRAGE